MRLRIVLLVIILLIIIVNIILHSRQVNEVLLSVPSGIVAEIDDTIELPEVSREKKIPKIIHRAVKDLDDIGKFKNAYDRTKLSNPNYEQIYYGDSEQLNFIKQNYSERIVNAYNSIRNEFGPAKADLFRYLLIYLKGGIYLDDKSAVIKNLDKIIDNNHKLLVSRAYTYPVGIIPFEHISDLYQSSFTTIYGEYSNWFVISPPGNIALKNVILQTVSNIEFGMKNKNIYNKSKKSVLFMTGPIMYSNVIEKNKKYCEEFKPCLERHLTYITENHKKVSSGKHYSKLEDMNILKV